MTSSVAFKKQSGLIVPRLIKMPLEAKYELLERTENGIKNLNTVSRWN